MIDYTPPAIVRPADDLTAWIHDREARFEPSAADVAEMALAEVARHPAVVRIIAAATAVVEGDGQYFGDIHDLWACIVEIKNMPVAATIIPNTVCPF